MRDFIPKVDSQSYTALRSKREELLSSVSLNHDTLQSFHNELIGKALSIAIQTVEKESGPPPAPFTFFQMGSAGRQEQGVVSDQDHGLFFEGEGKIHQEYFLALGAEISNAMDEVGYDICDGKIMANHPTWCLSQEDWKKQLETWLEERDWASLRHLLIFFDSYPIQSLTADKSSENPIMPLKEMILERIQNDAPLFERLIQNTRRIKKYISPLGQFYTETHGPHYRSLNIKHAILFPFVHSVRLLAMKEHIIHVTSTKERLEELMELSELYATVLSPFYETYIEWLKWRAEWQLAHYPMDYDSSHYIPIDQLSSNQRKCLKKVVKSAYSLTKETSKILAKGEA
ncbi:DUF294 nucleotidyltransferase-like domain-containing protein [Bacillus horti]|uniref:CBS domain-containing protein n=1 Tax=Caldalkalibacillus horti TaxID=77523 RepID=A0ABT9VWR1_9BACI|nr:DUF294 nucleotidyltransferase-like domain-containing protein [Bacillus horti]MDQ0165417.1 CBS domain-containing protein [Bacillus horti]